MANERPVLTNIDTSFFIPNTESVDYGFVNLMIYWLFMKEASHTFITHYDKVQAEWDSSAAFGEDRYFQNRGGNCFYHLTNVAGVDLAE